MRKKTLQNSADIHLIFRLRLLPESVVAAVYYRLVIREIHKREEIVVPGIVVAILPLMIVHDGVIEQLVIQGLAVAAAADKVARERALEEATG